MPNSSVSVFRSASRRHVPACVLFCLTVGALTLAWSLLLRHNLGRTEALMLRVTEQKERNLTLLSADVLEYRDYYERFPRTWADWTDETVYVEYYKRAAYGPISAALNTIVHSVLHVPFPASMYLILSFYAALASTLMFVLLRTLGLGFPESTLLAGAATVSFSWLSLFSVPESYSLSVCATIVAAISGSRLPALEAPGATRALIRHVIVVGVLAWIYLPVCGAVLLAAARVTHARQWTRLVAPSAVAAVLFALAPQVLVGLDALRFQLDYANRLSSASHFEDPSAVGQVATAFMLFGLVTPVPDFIHAPATPSIRAALSAWPTLVVSAFLLCGYGALAWRVVVFRRVRALAGALLWFASLYLFHVLYNPSEVLLYVSIPTAVLVYIVGLALAPIAGPHPQGSARERLLILGALATLVGALMAANARAVL